MPLENFDNFSFAFSIAFLEISIAITVDTSARYFVYVPPPLPTSRIMSLDFGEKNSIIEKLIFQVYHPTNNMNKQLFKYAYIK